MANNKKVLLKRSNVVENGSPKLPTAGQMEYGELAMNYADGYETLSFKNSNNEVVKFESTEKMKSYVDTKISDAISSTPEEVYVGTTTPTGTNKPDIFVDLSVDPVTTEIYSKEQVDEKFDSTVSLNTTSNGTSILIDENAGDSIEVYTRAQVDAIIAQLKADNNLR